MARRQGRELTEENRKLLMEESQVNERADEIDIGALGLRLLEKVHWIVIASFLCAALAGVYVYFVATPIYEATSKIYLVGSETAISLSDLQIGTNLAADYQEVFKNWHVHELVDKRLELDYAYTELASMLTVTNPPNTHVVYITIKSPDPEEAKLMADTYANVAREFIAEKMDIREPNVFEEAQLPTIPISPKKIRTIVIGFAVGMVLSTVIILLRFISDDRIRTSDDIRQAGNLPVLGVVPIQTLKAEGQEFEIQPGSTAQMD